MKLLSPKVVRRHVPQCPVAGNADVSFSKSMAQANNVHVAAVVADGDEERFRFKVGYLAGDVQRGVLLRRRLARLLLQLDHAGRLLLDRRQHQRRAQLGQLRVYAETDRSKLAAADIHRVVVVVVAVVVVIYRMFITCLLYTSDAADE